MPKGKYLNNYEKGKIDALLNLNYSVYEISQKVRSKRVIYNYIRLGKSYGKSDKNKATKSILFFLPEQNKSIPEENNPSIKISKNLYYISTNYYFNLTQNLILYRMKEKDLSINTSDPPDIMNNNELTKKNS